MVISQRNHALLQPCYKVNIAKATIALLAAWLCILAIYNLMSLASQFGYFRLVRGKI